MEMALPMLIALLCDHDMSRHAHRVARSPSSQILLAHLPASRLTRAHDLRAQDLVATLPAPANGILSLFGDGSHADKRGTKNPVAQKGRISKHHPWFFGLRFVLLRAAWDGYRIPVGFRLILPKRHAGYRSENALFREMVGEFVPPRWATRVIVGGDAAYGSKANIRLVQDR